MMRRSAGFVLATFFVLLRAESGWACGVERWSVKTGTDADSGKISLSPTAQTIATMRGWPAPSPIPANNRVSPYETTEWVLNATLTQYKAESDQDYHLVLQDAGGLTVIAEIPAPGCVGVGSPLASGVQNARSQFDARYSATSSFQTANVPVQVKGIGMFDFLHGQTGVAPNGIELHPILDIVFNPGGGGGGGDTQLASGVTLSGQSVAASAWKYYYISVPSGVTNLTLATSGASADVDIYTQSGAKPTSSSYVCRPYTSSGNESCSATSPAAGTWWLGVYGYAAGSYSVTGTYTLGGTTYTISGNAGTPSASVTAGSASATSDASSNFTLSGLAAGTYTVAPSKGGCTFTPASRSITVGPSATGVSFTASCGGGTTQLLANPGFESGAVSWTATSGVIDSSTGEASHSGSFKAWLNGYGAAHTDTLYQQVSVASTATSATLSFWLHVDTAETTTTTAYDTLAVQIRNSSGTVLATLATYSNLNAAAGYVQKSFSLIAYKGQTIQVYLVGTEGSVNQTSFVVDDFALNVQ